MSGKATIYDYARMCKKINECEDCPLGTKNNGDGIACSSLMIKAPDKANEIILKWCEEHPVQTRQSEFLKTFPNAKMDNDGVLVCCPNWADKNFRCNMDGKTCTECRKEYWLAEVDE